MRYVIVLFTLALVALSVTRSAAQVPSQLSDAYGVRLGIAGRSGVSQVLPLLNPYYEAPFGSVTLSAELLLAFQNFQTIDIPTFQKFYLDSYGFRAKLRFVQTTGMHQSGDLLPYAAAGIGFDAFSDRVSFTMPVSAGLSSYLSSSSALEVSAFVEPLIFFGLPPGIRYGATVGLRFLNFKP